MKTISSIVQDLLFADPLALEAAGRGIANMNALAREMHCDVQKARMEDVSLEAVGVALRRLEPSVQKQFALSRTILPVQHLGVHRNITLLAYKNSPKLDDIYDDLLHKTHEDNTFLHYIPGTYDSIFLLSTSVVPMAEKLLEQEKRLHNYENCSSITLQFAHEHHNTPGAFLPYFRLLALHNISVLHVQHSFTELGLVVDDADTDAVLDIVQSISK